MYVRILLASALALLVGCSDDTPDSGCTSTTDCAADEVCTAGACVPRDGADAGVDDATSDGQDAGGQDARAGDAGPADAGVEDGGRADAGAADAEVPDLGPPDVGHAPLRLTFPPRGSVTDADRITVRGVSAAGANLTEVRINGVSATSTDGFATFSAQVPLALGPVNLDVALAGGETFLLGEVERQEALLLAPRDFERRGRDLYVVDSGFRQLVRIDLDTGARTKISGGGVGSSQPFLDPRGVALSADGSHAYVVDTAAASVLVVHIPTGARRIVSSSAQGGGPALSAPRRLVLDGGRLLVVDSDIDAVVAVDITSGDRTLISDDDTGDGPPFASPRDIALDVANNRVLVADSSGSALFSVDLTSGDRTVLQGAGPFFATPRGVTLSADGSTAFVADGDLATIFSVDLASGDRTIVTDGTAGGRGPWVDPRRIALGDNGALLVLDYITDAIVSVDPASGDRTVIAQSAAGTGPHLGGPWGIAVDVTRPGAPVVVSDNFFERIFEIDLTFAQRRIASELIHPGPNLDQPYGMTWDPMRSWALVVDAVLDALVAVDVSSGARTAVSNDVIGAGAPLNAPRDVAVSADGRIFVVDSGADAVIEIDPVSGDRTVRSDDSVGSGPALDAPWAIEVTGPGQVTVADSGLDGLFDVDLATGARTERPAGAPAYVTPRGLAKGPGGRLFVSDLGLRAILSVDGATRAVVSDDSTGLGPRLSEPAGLLLHPDGYLLVVDANDALFAIDPRTGDRVFASK